jgi:hypothetical protein
MEPVVVRPARPADAADLARNWVDVARHYAELDADAFRVPAGEGLAGWFEGLLRRPRREDAVWLVAPLSVPFYERGLGYQRRSIVFEKRLD